MAAALAAGLTFLMNQKSGETVKALYPITKTANVRNDDGTTLVELLAGKADKAHGNHVPEVEAVNNLKFLRCDNTWAEIQAASTTAAGVVQLSDAVTLEDSTKAATLAAVKKAYDKANHEHPYIKSSLMGVANGVATLDTTGLIPAGQLPSFVDDVVEGYMHADKLLYTEAGEAGTKITGESGKIYVDLGDGKTYRWSGTAFVVISDTLALGITASTAFRGDYGNIAYQHSQAEHARVDATLTEKSEQNGYIKINGTEILVYSHPGTGTNPHGTTAADVGLGKVENKSAREIIAEITKEDIEKVVGGTIATTTVVTEEHDGIMSSDMLKKLNACQRIYVQATTPTEDCLWYKTEEASA